jgi:hypothetical protein
MSSQGWDGADMYQGTMAMAFLRLADVGNFKKACLGLIQNCSDNVV